MLEMECTNLTPSSVLETSGHVDRFTDFMVKDEVTGECFRADKLLEDIIDALLAANPNMDIKEQEQHKIIQRQADAFSENELHDMLQRYGAKSPSNPLHGLTKPFPFNLMFRTTIGPEGTAVGYLRPETAQGLFVNFRYDLSQWTYRHTDTVGRLSTVSVLYYGYRTLAKIRVVSWCSAYRTLYHPRSESAATFDATF